MLPHQGQTVIVPTGSHWFPLHCQVKITEETTTSSSRIFIKAWAAWTAWSGRDLLTTADGGDVTHDPGDLSGALRTVRNRVGRFQTEDQRAFRQEKT